MHILIIGAGAIGSMLAARLAASGQRLTLAARPETAAILRERGLRLVDSDGAVLTPEVTIVDSASDVLAGKEAFSFLILAVKSYHVASLAAELATVSQPLPPLISLQNGVGNEETLAANLPQASIIAGTLTTPVEVLEPGHVHVSRPSYWLGLAPGPGAHTLDPFISCFEAAGFRVQSWPDYKALKWSKLLMNLLANAQSAILDWTPAQLFAHPLSARIELLAWREAIQAMKGLNLRPVPLAQYPLRFATTLTQFLPPRVVKPLFSRFIISGRGTKMPSLYFDLHPQPRTHSEIYWLNGAVAATAQAQGRSAPINDTLTQVFTALLQQQADPTAWKGRPDKLWAAMQSHE